jgi:hypothetical protein
MKQHFGKALTASVLMIGVVALPALAEPPRGKLVGTWRLVSEVAHAGGQASEPLGPHPLGSMMLDDKGHFMLMIARPDLPSFAANKREAGTAEENKAVLAGSLSFFGTYTVRPGVLTLRPAASTFPNWVGHDQERYFELEGTRLKWTNKTPAIGAEFVELVWVRAR